MKNVKLFLIGLLSVAGWLSSCKEKTDYLEALNGNEYLIDANLQATNVMVHDIFSPPVASRIYTYSSLAAYEVAVLADPQYRSLMGQLNGFEEIKILTLQRNVFFLWHPLAAYYQVATAMIFLKTG